MALQRADWMPVQLKPQNSKSSAAFLQTVIPEAILIGNPESQGPKIWIPDKDTRG
jgi:hypothetical protein